MALIELFFTQKAVIRPFVRQGAGEPIYGPAETRKCRIERGKKLGSVGRASGIMDDIPAGARMFCTGNPIPPRSIVECGDRNYIVIECVVATGFADHHLEVTLQ